MNAQVPSDPLSVGDVGVIIRALYHPEHIGRECVVVMPLGWYKSRQDGIEIFSYKVEVDGNKFLVRPENIRKKRPPREDLTIVRWNECPWKPESLRA